MALELESVSRAVGLDTQNFLESFVLAAKFRMIYECGAWPGGAYRALSQTQGEHIFWESQEELATQMPGAVHGHCQDYSEADLTFLDCGPSWMDRFKCLARWMDTATPGALLIVDDAPHVPHPSKGVVLDIGHGLWLYQKEA